jgi:hypothetical protein
MTFPHINRRLHLYLGLFLLPWFFIYGLSSVPFSHPAWMRSIYGEPRPWSLRFERHYELPVPADGDLREIGAILKKEAGASGAYGASRPNPDRINVFVRTFWNVTQISYDISAGQLRAEDRPFRSDNWLTSVHTRGGFQQETTAGGDGRPWRAAWARLCSSC